jgi:hypothetical protein
VVSRWAVLHSRWSVRLGRAQHDARSSACMRARCLRISCVSRHDRSVRSARLIGQASLGSRPYRRLSARVSRAVDHRELPRRPGAERCPGCRAAMIARGRLPGRRPRTGQAAADSANTSRKGAGARPGSLLLSLGEYHRTGDISPVRGFKSPLGHPEWCCVTNLQVPLEHADGPADACGLPTALTGPASRHGRQP